MKAVFSAKQLAHDPQFFMHKGNVVLHPDRPERAEMLLKGAERAGCDIIEPEAFDRDVLVSVHDADYLTFLKGVYQDWRQIKEVGAEVIPNVLPLTLPRRYPQSLVGRAGWHQSDLACPIGKHCWASAKMSASTALTAAGLVLGGERAVYALCRPPGHHAYHDRAGGFCYLNNTALAAQSLRSSHDRIAILDIDVHHGNGTQGIFYDRSDVLTVSIHTDPSNYYPFFWGYDDEVGQGEGTGFNLNISVPQRSGDDVWIDALTKAGDRINDFDPGALVVALGLDAFAGDPLRGGAVTTEGFAKLAAGIASLDLPTVIVQEGGYLTPELGENLTSFLDGFKQ